MSTTIPKQLYVTVQYRSDVKQEDSLLGFASPYTKDDAFRKRKSTQDSWAYGYGVSVNIDEQDEITVSGSSTKFDVAQLFMTNAYPRILNNEAVTGFQIAKSVRRHGWGGGGNVVWRISDPRGFDLEISSDNFARVIDCTTLENGVIKEACVWGREGSKNILLPVTSDVYRAAEQLTSLADTKVSVKNVQLGDRVVIIDKKEKDGFLEARYLGRAFMVIDSLEPNSLFDHNSYWTSTSDNSPVNLRGGVFDRYVFETADGNFYFSSKPVISKVVQRAVTPLTQEEAMTWLNFNAVQGKMSVGYQTPYMVVPTESAAKKITVELEALPKFDSSFDLTNLADPARYWAFKYDLYVFEHEGKLYVPFKARIRQNYGYVDGPMEFFRIDRDCLLNSAQIQVKGQTELDSSVRQGYAMMGRTAYKFVPEILENPPIDSMIPHRVYLRSGNIRTQLTMVPNVVASRFGC